MRRVVLAVLLLAIPGMARAQAWLSDPGSAGTQVAEIGNARLKLPPGTWELVAELGEGSSNFNAVSFRTKLYLQVLDGKVGAIIAVGANETAATGRQNRWLVPNQCGAKSSANMVVDAKVEDSYLGSYDCMLVTFTKLNPDKDNPLFGPLLTRAASIGGMPPAMLYTAFNKTSPSRFDAINVKMFVNPATPSFAAAVRSAGIATTAPTSGNMLTLMTSWSTAYRSVVAGSIP